jgi:hypothetical protein
LCITWPSLDNHLEKLRDILTRLWPKPIPGRMGR